MQANHNLDYIGYSLFLGDDGFGDLHSMEDTPSELRSGSGVASNLRDESLFQDEPQPSTSAAAVDSHMASPAKDNNDDGFGQPIGSSDMLSGGLFEGGGLFSEPTLDMTQKDRSERRNSFSDDDHDNFGGMPSPGGASSMGGTSRPGTPPPLANAVAAAGIEPPVSDETPQIQQNTLQVTAAEQTTLLQNEEESFALAPVDASMMKGTVRTKRKRKLIVDEVKAIAGEEMKAQLSDTQDIVTSLDLAPPTKRLMHWKETGGVEKLFALPGRPLHARGIFKFYQSHLTSKPAENEVFGMLGDSEQHENIQLEKVPGEDEVTDPRTPLKRGRKRRKDDGDDESPEKPTPTRKSARNAEAAKENQPPQQVFNPNVETTPVETPQQPQFENLGYDASEQQPSQQMENLGWSEDRGAPTPGAVSMGGATPYRDDDFDGYPASVGPQSVRGDEEEEERGEEETQEEFEDRVLNKRAAHLNKILSSKLENEDSVVRLSDMTRRNTRKQVAQKFYSLLVLQKVMAVNLNQDECYGELSVTRGPKFETAVL